MIYVSLNSYVNIYVYTFMILNQIHSNSNNQHSSMFTLQIILTTIQTHSKTSSTSPSICTFPNFQSPLYLYFHNQSQSTHFNSLNNKSYKNI